MVKLETIIVGIVLTATSLLAQDTIPFNFGIAPGLSIRRTDQAVVHFNANLISSRALSTSGADLAGLVSNVTNDMEGLQASGIVSNTRSLTGFQTSGISSRATGDVTGYQISGIVSSTAGNLRGVQVSGVVNTVRGTTFGGQSGFINVARDLTGFQAGFINISRQLNGVPFGIINIAENGRVSAIAYGSNFSALNIGAKFIANNFVTTITIGGRDVDRRLNEAAAFATSWGYHIPLEPLYLEIDLAGMNMVQTADFDIDNTHTRRLNALRATLGVDVTGFLGILIGAGVGYEREYEGDTLVQDDFKPLFFGGVTLF